MYKTLTESMCDSRRVSRDLSAALHGASGPPSGGFEQSCRCLGREYSLPDFEQGQRGDSRQPNMSTSGAGGYVIAPGGTLPEVDHTGKPMAMAYARKYSQHGLTERGSDTKQMHGWQQPAMAEFGDPLTPTDLRFLAALASAASGVDGYGPGESGPPPP